MRRTADRTMAALAQLLIHVFFRRVTVEGAELLPVDGPAVLVANHLNGLVDGLLLIATLRRYPRFLGKSTLFKILPLRPFLTLAGVVPVFRAKDNEPGASNESTFRTCRRLLASGGLVALFPEGISHDESMLQPLRTGAARIALGAAVDDGIAGVVTVAVGLVYDAKARFRSRALVRLSPAVSVQPFANGYRADSHLAVRQLTDRLADQLRSVSPSYQSWQQAALLSRIAEVSSRPADGRLPEDVELVDQEHVAQQLAAVEASTGGGEVVRELRQTFAGYERDLSLLGLSDSQVAASYRKGRVRATLAWSVAKVLLALPVALVGAVIHVVPYQLIKRVAARPTNEGIKATVKLLGCFALFTLTYVAMALAVGRRYGLIPGLVVVVGAPLCGYTTVRLVERVKRIGGLLEGYRIVKERRTVMQSVLAARAQVTELTRVAIAANSHRPADDQPLV